MRFDGRLASKDNRLNHVGIKGALGQVFHLAEFAGLFLKDLDKTIAYPFAFFFRICNPGQLVKKVGFRLNIYDLQVCFFTEKTEHAFTLACTHQPVVHINTG